KRLDVGTDDAEDVHATGVRPRPGPMLTLWHVLEGTDVMLRTDEVTGERPLPARPGHDLPPAPERPRDAERLPLAKAAHQRPGSVRGRPDLLGDERSHADAGQTAGV